MATHSSIPAWGIPWTEEPGRRMTGETSEISPGLLQRSTPSKVENLLMDIHLLIQVFSGKEENLTKGYYSVVNIFITF